MGNPPREIWRKGPQMKPKTKLRVATALLSHERATVYRRIKPCGCFACTNARVAEKPMPTHEMIFGVIDPRTFRYFLCETCGNKRCPHATDHRNACTGSNEPGQAGSRYAATAQGTSVRQDHDPQGREAKPAGPVGEADAPEPL